MKTSKLLDKLEKYFLVSSLVIVVLLIFIQVVLRKVFNYSLSWAEELARYILLYQIWIGASYCVAHDAHIRITMLQKKFSERNQIIIEIIVTVLWTTFSLFLTIKSAELTFNIFKMGQISPAMQIPMGIAYASVPIGCGLMTFRLCQKLLRDINKLEKKEVDVQ